MGHSRGGVGGMARSKLRATRERVQSFTRSTLTALTITSTLSPLRMPSSFRDSRVMTEPMRDEAGMVSLTRHMTLPFLMSVTLPVMRLRAPTFISYVLLKNVSPDLRAGNQHSEVTTF